MRRWPGFQVLSEDVPLLPLILLLTPEESWKNRCIWQWEQCCTPSENTGSLWKDFFFQEVSLCPCLFYGYLNVIYLCFAFFPIFSMYWDMCHWQKKRVSVSGLWWAATAYIYVPNCERIFQVFYEWMNSKMNARKKSILASIKSLETLDTHAKKYTHTENQHKCTF